MVILQDNPNLQMETTFTYDRPVTGKDNIGRRDEVAILVKAIRSGNNIAIYERPIRIYEQNDLQIRDGKIFINGQETTKYTFKMDYYWMMGDNRHNSADSRYWGFVPEDHIVGPPLFIWWSVCPDTNPAASTIRWNRLFRWVPNIK